MNGYFALQRICLHYIGLRVVMWALIFEGEAEALAVAVQFKLPSGRCRKPFGLQFGKSRAESRLKNPTNYPFTFVSTFGAPTARMQQIIACRDPLVEIGTTQPQSRSQALPIAISDDLNYLATSLYDDVLNNFSGNLRNWWRTFPSLRIACRTPRLRVYHMRNSCKKWLVLGVRALPRDPRKHACRRRSKTPPAMLKVSNFA